MLIFLIILIIVIGLYFVGIALQSVGNSLENVSNNILAKHGIHAKASFIHLGGHPYLKPNEDITIMIQNSNLLLLTFKEKFEIPISNIIDIQIQNEEELTSRTTLTRLALLGVFALATPKTETTNNQYLYLKYLQNNVEIECIFKAILDGDAGKILSTFNRLKLENNL